MRDPSKVTLDPVNAAAVAEIFVLYLEPTGSLAGVSKMLEQRGISSPTGRARWSSMTLRGILTNPVYTGQVYADRTRYQPPQVRCSVTHPIGQPHGTAVATPRENWVLIASIPAIVTQEQWDQVQTKLHQNKALAQRNNSVHQYLLPTLVSCGHCHLCCFARTVNQHHHYYICLAKSNSLRVTHPQKCDSRYLPANQLDAFVWQDLCAVLTQPELIQAELERAQGEAWLPQELQARAENLRKAHRALEQQLDRLTEAYLQGIVPLAEYERRRRGSEQKIQALTAQARELQAQAQRQVELTRAYLQIRARGG
jgi:site-specific DNA recombinase